MASSQAWTGDPALYEVASQFRDRGFREDDSVFTPGVKVWTAANFEVLERDFVEAPDEGGRSFIEKLRDQLRASPDGARQLFAELFCFHLLVSATVSREKKQELIGTVLDMMDVPVAVPQSVVDAFGMGIVNPGTYFNTGRPVQLGYLVLLGRRWKALPPIEREKVIDDPWLFKAFAEQVNQSGTTTQFRAALHLLYPQSFEAIVSTAHINQILSRFGDPTTSDGRDPDHRLQEVREALSPRYGDAFNFYDERIEALWRQGIDPWPDLIQWARKLYEWDDFDAEERAYKLAAGRSLEPVIASVRSGGSWRDGLFEALRSPNLVRWQTVDNLRTWLEEAPDAETTLRQALIDLWNEQGEIGDRVQAFADSISPAVMAPGERTSLASFLVMGLDATTYPIYKPTPFTQVFELIGRAQSSEHEGARYRRVLTFCDEMRSEASERGLSLRDNLDVQGIVWLLHKGVISHWPEDEQQAFLAWRDGTAPEAEPEETVDQQGEPGDARDTGSLMRKAATECHVPLDYLHRLVHLLDDKGQIVMYGPPGTGKTYIAQELAFALTSGKPECTILVQFHPSTTYEDFFEGIRPSVADDGTLRYEVMPGPLARMAEDARNAPDQRFVMVIDELNRANLPKVLGELLFLLEYRSREATTLYRPTEPFTLPSNLLFIATMNTVDRSVALIDAAMRRRFHFVPMYPDVEPISDVLPTICTDSEAWVPALVARVNETLLRELGGRDHLIGPSHFIKATRTLVGIETVWRHSIEPLIEDQLFGQDDRMQPYRWERIVDDHSDLIPKPGDEREVPASEPPEEW